MKASEAGDAVTRPCAKCRRDISDCICSWLESSVAWPTTGNRPQSESEMSARFSKLKEADSGTTFSNLSNCSIDAFSGTDPGLSNAIDLAVDAIIGGVYKIIRLIGRGGMGEVYLATHMTLGKKCALKVMPPDQVTEVGWQRFQLEAKTVAGLEHVNLVRVTDLGIHEGCLPFCAMEYLDGKNLAEMLAEFGPMPLNKALEIFMQVCDGVDCAHRGGILHRDLKPANIMLLQSPNGKLEVKILDFGLAKLTRHNRFKQSLTAVGDVFGSPYYMSPEQCAGNELDSRSDIYSIGCTLFECLTGRPPFYGHLSAAVFFGHLESPPPSLENATESGKFPQAMEIVMAKILRKDPDQRYQTLAELKADLMLVAGGEEIPAPVVSAPADSQTKLIKEQGAAPIKRVAVMVGALLLLLGCGAGAYFVKFTKPQAVPSVKSAVPQNSQNKLRPPAAGSQIESSMVTSAAYMVQDGEVASQWDGTPFYRGIVQHNGRNCQYWSYHGNPTPPVYLEVDVEGKNVELQALVGDFYWPASAKICLMPRLRLVKEPRLIQGLAGGNYDKIDFEWFSLPDINKIMPALTESPSIEAVHAVKMGSFAWSLADSRASVTTINEFPKLERLLLFAKYEGSSIARISRLKKLKELRLNNSQPFLHDCLQVLGLCENLQAFSVSNWGLPPSDLTFLLKCSHLERLMIGQLTGSHEQFCILEKLPYLKQLEMPALRYRPGLIEDLKRLKRLRTLKVVFDNEWTQSQFLQLRQELPDVQFFMYSSAQEQRQGLWRP